MAFGFGGFRASEDNDTTSHGTPPMSTTDGEEKALLQSLSNLFENGKYSDLEIVCGERKWRMHKAILCERSEYFEKACKWEFKESATHTITLHDDRHEAVAAMLRFLYTGSYDDTAHQRPATKLAAEPSASGEGEGEEEVKVDEQADDDDDDWLAPLLFNLIVHATADKYTLTGLCAVAEKKFQARIAAGDWQKEDFSIAVGHLWRDPLDSQLGFRNIALDAIVKQHDTLVKDKEGEYNHFAETVKANGQLAWDMCLALKSGGAFRLKPQPKQTFNYKCYKCAHVFRFETELRDWSSHTCPSCLGYNPGRRLKDRKI